MAVQNEFLSFARINGFTQGLQDVRTLPQRLIWSERIPFTPATDEEILARFVGTVKAADLIADDAKAPVYSQGRWQTETTRIPNIKVGVAMNQTLLNQIYRFSQGGGLPMDRAGIDAWQRDAQMRAVLGVRQREEALRVAMLCDSFSYNKLGIIMSGVTWGMPSDLKVTTGVTWDTAATATPVNDIWGVQLTAQTRYGITYDRITMSTQAFRYMIATTEFQNKARVFLAPNVSFVNLTQADIGTQRRLAGNILGMEVELYDQRYWVENTDGSTTLQTILPITSVILTATANDGNNAAYDFAHSIPTEALVGAATDIPNINIGVGFGPLGYATLADQNLNPPGVIQWAVDRGFPRKKMLQSSACLTVGAFSDTISTTVPFPA